mmetsp:Transcript_4637/g.11935  ORF Transcript_4637/g.11935 Transcript_4637/m.11935 type:complete len:245 (-) Transcript_4637:131-865(-)
MATSCGLRVLAPCGLGVRRHPSCEGAALRRGELAAHPRLRLGINWNRLPLLLLPRLPLLLLLHRRRQHGLRLQRRDHQRRRAGLHRPQCRELRVPLRHLSPQLLCRGRRLLRAALRAADLCVILLPHLLHAGLLLLHLLLEGAQLAQLARHRVLHGCGLLRGAALRGSGLCGLRFCLLQRRLPRRERRLARLHLRHRLLQEACLRAAAARHRRCRRRSATGRRHRQHALPPLVPPPVEQAGRAA